MKKNPIKSDLRETTAGKVTFLFLLFLYTGVMLYLFWMECYQVPGFQSERRQQWRSPRRFLTWQQ